MCVFFLFFFFFPQRLFTEFHNIYSKTNRRISCSFLRTHLTYIAIFLQGHLTNFVPLPRPFDEFPFKIIVISLLSFGHLVNFTIFPWRLFEEFSYFPGMDCRNGLYFPKILLTKFKFFHNFFGLHWKCLVQMVLNLMLVYVSKIFM